MMSIIREEDWPAVKVAADLRDRRLKALEPARRAWEMEKAEHYRQTRRSEHPSVGAHVSPLGFLTQKAQRRKRYTRAEWAEHVTKMERRLNQPHHDFEARLLQLGY